MDKSASWPQSIRAHRRHSLLPPLRPPGRIEPRCHMHPGDHMRIPALEMVGESTIIIYIYIYTYVLLCMYVCMCIYIYNTAYPQLLHVQKIHIERTTAAAKL